jgi:hypothetical protein
MLHRAILTKTRQGSKAGTNVGRREGSGKIEDREWWKQTMISA